MSIVLPKELQYAPSLPSLPPDTINTSIVVSPSNGASFTENQIIQLDLPASGFMDPNTVYLRYKATAVQATAVGGVRGTPAASPFVKLEVLFGSQVVETIMNYNMIYNMVSNLQMNVAQKAGSANLGYLDNSTTPTFVNQNGRAIAIGTTSAYYALPLMCLLSGAEHLIPLFAMPNVRIQLTLDANSNFIWEAATGVTTSYTLTNVELCFDKIDFGYNVENMVRSMGEKVYIKSNSWASMSQNMAITSGTNEYIFNARYASIRSLFANFGGTTANSANKNFDSYDVTQGATAGGGGDLQWFCAGNAYPSRSVSTITNRAGVLAELKMAINGGLHSLQAQNMSITPQEFNTDGDDATTYAIPAKFWFGTNVEKFSTAGALLSGISTQNSPVSLRINFAAPTAAAYNLTMIVLFDALIEIDFMNKNASVKQ